MLWVCLRIKSRGWSISLRMRSTESTRNVRAGKKDVLPELFRRASYLCKGATKSYGDHYHGFGYSRG